MRLPRIALWKRGVKENAIPFEEVGDVKERAPKPYDTFCNRTRIFYAIVVLLLAVAVPLIVYFVVVSDNLDVKPELWTCNIKDGYRIWCPNATFTVNENTCMKLGCCWNNSNDGMKCFHSLPSRHSYSVENWTENITELITELNTEHLDLTPRMNKCLYGNRAAVELQTRVVSTSSGSILHFYLYDSTTNASDVKDTTPLDESEFKVKVLGREYFSVQINRSKNATQLLFSTSLGPTIACDDYWELALEFPQDAAVFGLGELRLNSEPKLLYNSGHRLGANPFIMILDTEGRAHGILFNNKGPMEFNLLEISNILIVKSRSKVMWNITVFAGPSPADVMEQYTSINGLRPILPPAWALGFHICRDTERKNGTLGAEDALYFVQKAKERNLPYESDCLQEGLLYGLNFSNSFNMTAIKQEFIDLPRKLLLSLPPHVEFPPEELYSLMVWNETGPLQETFRGLEVMYPDFFNGEWQDTFRCNSSNLPKNTEDILGGFVLQDNWPASETTHNTSEDIPVTEGALSTGTLWWNYLHENESHYRIHNEYGLRHAELVKNCEDAKPELVLSAATHTRVGAVGGCHAHRQVVVAPTWSNMKTALETALGLGLTGIPLSGGGSVCGTMGLYDEELCIRWYLMSSMLPLMRVSSEAPLRDPVNLPSKTPRQAAKAALELRYSLLPYFYSLFHEASRTGVPVARPMFFEFPDDKETWTIDEQFMIGPALMASPAFYKGAVTVNVYLPRENTTWYHFIGGHQVNNGTGGVTVPITSLLRELVLLLRGGFILPYQKADLTVNKTLAGAYNLAVGLRCKEDGACSASGSLYIDSEDSQTNLTFTANKKQLSINGTCSKCNLQDVSVYGLGDSITICNIVSMNEESNCIVKKEKGVTLISDLKLNLSNSVNYVIKWGFEAE